MVSRSHQCSSLFTPSLRRLRSAKQCKTHPANYVTPMRSVFPSKPHCNSGYPFERLAHHQYTLT